MRLLVQRVNRAAVIIDDKIHSKIDKGLLVFIGVHKEDCAKQISWCIEKLIHLRIFEDELGKMNLNVQEVASEILIVSQFTLYGNCQFGRRPSFTEAAPPEIALNIYNQFLENLSLKYNRVKSGVFQAHMHIELENDGPITLFIESPK